MSTEVREPANQLAEARSQIEVARRAIGTELRQLNVRIKIGQRLAPQLEAELTALVRLELWQSVAFTILAKSHPPSAEQCLIQSIFHPGVHIDRRPGDVPVRPRIDA
jgi:hypothetical protein